VEKRIINYNFSPLLQGLSKINTITILKDEIIEQHIQNWLAIFHTGFLHQQKQFTSQPVRNMPAGTLYARLKKDSGTLINEITI
jgi:CRISPR/Cas system endoribonuclease Cas6 (RAMP superfamily)